MILPRRSRQRDFERDEQDRRPSWVGLTGLLSLTLGLALIPVALLSGSPFARLRDLGDLFSWAVVLGLWLGPPLLAFSFVLTIVRPNRADWQRGGYLFLGFIAYLAAALAGLRYTS